METAIHPNIKYIVGIDEAGRGPIAGPVAVGAVLLPLHWAEPPKVRDSKHLAQHKRESQFDDMKHAMKEGEMRFSVAMSTSKTIDTIGIVPAVNTAMQRALSRLDFDPE